MPDYDASSAEILSSLSSLMVDHNLTDFRMNSTEVFSGRPPTTRVATMYPIAYRITGTVLHTMLFFVGFFGNIIICLVVKRTRSLHTPTYCYLVSLAVADLILVCFAIPEAILSYHLYSKQWVLGHLGCSLMAFSTFLAINAGSISILAFTVERYIAICHPMHSQKVCTVTRARNIILAVWIFVLAYCCPWLYFTTTRPLNLADVQGLTYCDYRLTRETYLIVFLADFVIFYAMPLIISIILYARIGYVIFRSMKKHELHRKISAISPDCKPTSYRTTLGLSPDRDVMMASRERLNSAYGDACKNRPPGSGVEARFQVVKMLIVVVVSFAILWAPYRGLLVYNSIAHKKFMNMWFVLFCKTLVYFNSTLNPFLYTVFSKKFRAAFFKILLCQKKSKRNQMSFMELMSPHTVAMRSMSTTTQSMSYSPQARRISAPYRKPPMSPESHSLLK